MSGHTALVYTRGACEAFSSMRGASKAAPDSKAGSSRGASRGAADKRGGGGKGGGKGGEKGGKGKSGGRADIGEGESGSRGKTPTRKKQSETAAAVEEEVLGQEGSGGVGEASEDGAASGMELDLSQFAYDAGQRGRSAGACEQLSGVGKRKARDDTSVSTGRDSKRRGGGEEEHNGKHKR